MTTIKSLQAVLAMLMIGLSAQFCSAQSASDSQKVYEISAYSPGHAGKIGKGSGIHDAATVKLTVNIPLDAVIVDIVPGIRKPALGRGRK